MSLLKKGFNAFAKSGTSLNRGLNKVIGKEVFQDIRQIEEPKEFPPLDTVPLYNITEPEQWTVLKGEPKVFTIEGNTISVSAEFDTCMLYRESFKTVARYYADSFKFRYEKCIVDFDSLIHYFPDLYVAALKPMLERAYNLLLPFGVFNIKIEDFTEKHMNTFGSAIRSFETMQGIEATKNQNAENLGNQIGGAVQMQGGGFGFKGAVKGATQAGLFNAGMGLIGKYISNQAKMTQEEKAKAFGLFKQDLFFEEVYNDYYNTFLSFIQTLSDCKVIENITIYDDSDFSVMIQNLQNPMFPHDKFVSSIAGLISSHPFHPQCYKLLEEKFGQTEEINSIRKYFMGA